MRLPLKLFLFAVLISIFLFNLPFSLKAETKCDEVDNKAQCLSDLIKEYESKIGELQGKQRTLATTIQVLDSQIALTLVQISATEANIIQLNNEIQQLSLKIGQLNDVLADVSQVLSARIEETYKRLLISPVHFLFSANDFADFLSRLEYLRSAQYHDRELLYNMEEARLNFDQQKTLKEQKQQELEVLQKRLNTQKLLLGQQKGSKQRLLQETRNDEQVFQGLLAKARTEFLSIQAILAGKGEEVEVGEVGEGDVITSLIVGGSCNSSGTHLHFTIADSGGNTINPFEKLKSVDYENCSGSSCGSGDGDSFNPSGSWNWPMNPKIRMNQGYGHTWAVANTWVGQIYSFHNGIDITGSSYDVKSVQAGTLYRGSYTGSGGCRLPYMKIKHKDGDLNTYYLHVVLK